jgi:hypothetical protein
VIRISQARLPVFVDPNGTRRRALRRLAYTLAAVILVLLLLFWMSQLGAPVRPAPAGALRDRPGRLTKWGGVSQVTVYHGGHDVTEPAMSARLRSGRRGRR